MQIQEQFSLDPKPRQEWKSLRRLLGNINLLAHIWSMVSCFNHKKKSSVHLTTFSQLKIKFRQEFLWGAFGEALYQGRFRHVNLETNSGKFWMFSVWSDKFAKCSINTWSAVYSVQCVVWSVDVQIQGHLQVQVQCILYTVQCTGCSVMPTKDEDLAGEQGE